MERIMDCTDELIQAIRKSKEYARYRAAEEALHREPDLKEWVDEYRLRVYALQGSHQDLFEATDQVQHEFRDLFRNPLAAEYLDAESSVWRMLQRIVERISEGVAVELPVSHRG